MKWGVGEKNKPTSWLKNHIADRYKFGAWLCSSLHPKEGTQNLLDSLVSPGSTTWGDKKTQESGKLETGTRQSFKQESDG